MFRSLFLAGCRPRKCRTRLARRPELLPPPPSSAPTDLEQVLAENPNDELALLLSARKKRKETDEATRARVQVEMAQRMDTGVRVNPALASALGVVTEPSIADAEAEPSTAERPVAPANTSIRAANLAPQQLASLPRAMPPPLEPPEKQQRRPSPSSTFLAQAPRGAPTEKIGKSFSKYLSDHNPWTCTCKGTWPPTGSGRQFHTMRCHREIWLQAEKVKKFSGPRPTVGMIVTCYPEAGVRAGRRFRCERPKSDGWVEVIGDGSGDV